MSRNNQNTDTHNEFRMIKLWDKRLIDSLSKFIQFIDMLFQLYVIHKVC